MFNKNILQIWRLTTVVGNKKSYQYTNNKLIGLVEPVDAEFAALVGGSFGKTFRIFSDNLSADVREGDRLKEGSDEYEVRGVTKIDSPPKHLEVVAEKVVNQ